MAKNAKICPPKREKIKICAKKKTDFFWKRSEFEKQTGRLAFALLGIAEMKPASLNY